MDPLVDNPFFVLDLPATATAMDVERQGKKLIAMLELGLAAVATYASPLGPRARTVDDVRRAQHTLLDPARRLAFEVFAAAPRHGDVVAAVAVDAVDLTPALWWQP